MLLFKKKKRKNPQALTGKSQVPTCLHQVSLNQITLNSTVKLGGKRVEIVLT